MKFHYLFIELSKHKQQFYISTFTFDPYNVLEI